MAATLFDHLPDLYRPLFPHLFAAPIPSERFATCDQCAMACSPPRGRAAYHPDRKCCTYHPVLPNYLIGALLEDRRPEWEEGRRRMRALIERKVGITPFGLFPSRKHTYLVESGVGFGQSRILLCPFYLEKAGQCTIWPFREAVCATYFCKTVTASAGKDFWHEVKMYLTFVQDCLAGYALYELAMPVMERNKYQNRPMTPDDLDDLPLDAAAYSHQWDAWVGREEAFYRECYRLVTALDSDRYETLTGIPQRILLENIRRRHARMTALPEVPGIALDLESSGDPVTVPLPEVNLAMELPKRLFAFFDGETPLAGALARAESEDFEIDLDLLRVFFHHGILLEQGCTAADRSNEPISV